MLRTLFLGLFSRKSELALTYVVDGVRSTMLVGSTSIFGLGTDIGVLFVIVLVLALICARLYPRIIQ